MEGTLCGGLLEAVILELYKRLTDSAFLPLPVLYLLPVLRLHFVRFRLFVVVGR